MAGPYLVMLGIDNGIPPLVNHHDGRVMIEIAIAFAVSIVARLRRQARLPRRCPAGSARPCCSTCGERVFDHFQRLSIGFHERYTSGRVVARLTSDMDSISELVDGGIEDLVLSALSVVSIADDPALPRRAAGPGHAAVVPVPDLAVPLVPAGVGPGLPAHPRDGRAGHRAVRRVDGRHPGGADVPPRAPQPGDLRGRQRRLPAGEHEGVPADRHVLAGDQGDRQRHHRGRADLRRLPRAARPRPRSACSPRSCSTCAGSSSRCRSCSMFYNSLQSASAALEKLSGVLAEEPAVPEPDAPDDRSPASPGEVALRRRDLRVPAGPGRAAAPRPATSRPARRSRWSARPAPASRRSPSWCARFYDPTAGAVRLDGVDLRDLSDDDLRRAVVMVTQENFLFSGTIADNIRFGKPGRDRRRSPRRGAGDRRGRVHRGAAGRVRHRRPQARRPAVGRAAPAGRVRPGVPRRSGRC